MRVIPRKATHSESQRLGCLPDNRIPLKGNAGPRKTAQRDKTRTQRAHLRNKAKELGGSQGGLQQKRSSCQQSEKLPHCCLEIPEQVPVNGNQVPAKSEKNPTASTWQPRGALARVHTADASAQKSRSARGPSSRVVESAREPLRTEGPVRSASAEGSCHLSWALECERGPADHSPEEGNVVRAVGTDAQGLRRLVDAFALLCSEPLLPVIPCSASNSGWSWWNCQSQ